MSEELPISFGQLTHLLLGNFKAFKRTQRIPIRPITLIYGKNNSGKSSIIQALLYAEHVRRTENLDPSVILKDNHRVLEGGLDRLVHGRDGKRRPRFGWEWVNPGSVTGLVSGRYEQDLDKENVVLNAVLNGAELLKADDDFHPASTTPNVQHPTYCSALANVQRLLVQEFQLWILNEELSPEMRVVLESARERLEKGEFSSAIESVLFGSSSRLVIRDRSLPHPLAFAPKLQSDWDADWQAEGKRNTTLLAVDFERASRWIRELEDTTDDKLSSGLEGSLEAHVDAFVAERCAYILYRWLIDVWAHFTGPLEQLVRTVIYLGAIRSRPETVFFRDSRNRGDLIASINDRRDHPTTLAPQHRDWVYQRSAIERANRWLRKNKAHTGNIELCLHEPPLSEASGDLLPAGVAATLSLKDRDRKVSLSFAEVGYGLSQFIPVLLACSSEQNYSIGKSAIPAGTLLVEEPEAHVHPALQAEIGELFADAVTRPDHPLARIICETHSEHLLLRIKRLIRDPKHKLTADKVAVLYVENHGKESTVSEMPLNSNGELTRDWPGGFFEEGLREVLL